MEKTEGEGVCSETLFAGEDRHCTRDLTAIVTTNTSLYKSTLEETPSMGRGEAQGGETPVDELLATDGWWKKESQLSSETRALRG